MVVGRPAVQLGVEVKSGVSDEIPGESYKMLPGGHVSGDNTTISGGCLVFMLQMVRCY